MVTFVDYIIPDSPYDFGAILFWVLIIVLLIMVFIDLRLYLDHRKTSKKIEKKQQKLNTIEQMKISEEERTQEHDNIRDMVDKIIEINNL
jgi:uncharacterized membrane protein YciS (DUF1049 family)